MLKKYKSLQEYTPGVAGIVFNPYYLIRKAIYRNIKVVGKTLRGRMLDYGCGSSPYASLFPNCQYIGADIKTGYRDEKHGICLFDGSNLPFPDLTFNVILATEVLEHVEDLDATISELSRVLKPEGVLLVTTPFLWPEHEMPDDYRRITVRGMCCTASKHGLECVRVDKYGNFYTTMLQLWNAYMVEQIIKLPAMVRYIIMFMMIAPASLIGAFFQSSSSDSTFYLGSMAMLKKV